MRFFITVLLGITALLNNEVMSQDVIAAGQDSAIQKENPARKVQSAGNQSDSLKQNFTNKSDTLFNTINSQPKEITDSLYQIRQHLTNTISSRIDSLQQKLSKLQQSDSLITKKSIGSAIRHQIDSLQSLLSDKARLDEIGKFADIPQVSLSEKMKIPGNVNPSNKLVSGIPEVNLPNSSIPNIPAPGSPGEISELGQELNKVNDAGNVEPNIVGLDKHELPSGIPSEAQQLKNIRQDSTNNTSVVDQMIENRASQTREFQQLQGQEVDYSQYKDVHDQMQSVPEYYGKTDNLKEKGKEMATEQLTDYFSDHQEELTEARDLMSQLKKKYSTVLNSNDLSTAVKANSLKGVPFKKRLVFGMDFQLIRGEPVSLDLAPNVLYRFNKRFKAGIAGNVRVSLGIKDVFDNPVVQNVYGASAITQYKFYKSFFGYGEYKMQSTPLESISGSETVKRTWQDSFLIGIGKQIGFSKYLKGQVIFTYDLLHNDESPYPNAWDVKVGFQMSKINLKGIRF